MKRQTDDLLRFLDAAPTAFHAVELAAHTLREAGFTELHERDAWSLAESRGYFVRRGDSSIIVFRTGTDVTREAAFRIVLAHTDSPGFKIKAGSENLKCGCLRVSVEGYGSPIRSTWFDRELGIAGRALVSSDEGLTTALFNSETACAVIPNAAIHLNREINKGVEYNIQESMAAILTVSASESEVESYVKRLVAEKLETSEDSVRGYDAFLYPVEPSTLVGEKKDLFMSGRIDNLGMAHAVISALVEAQESRNTLVGALFDSEEIGSLTWHGARSWFLRDVLHRLVLCRGGGDEDFMRALAGSLLISGDAAHAVHPNYSDRHDKSFVPELNKGPVVKIHSGGAYTTDAETGGRFIELCTKNGIPVQRFLNRSDMASGSTIGPAASSSLGVPSLDVGNAIWGMHSARETAGVKDQDYMVSALLAFFADT